MFGPVEVVFDSSGGGRGSRSGNSEGYHSLSSWQCLAWQHSAVKVGNGNSGVS